jgi:endo-1,4-beta-xylanase
MSAVFQSGRRQFVLSSLATAAATIGLPGDAIARPQSTDLAVPYGAAVSSAALKDPSYRDAILRYCNLIVPEGALKWDPVHPRANQFDFSEADILSRFAKTNRISLRGTTLAWYAALPKWVEEVVNTREAAAAALVGHIQAVVGRYRGMISSWDVVNEPIADSPASEHDLRPSVWTKTLGPDYVEIAFRTAHQSDPDTKLYLNEFDLEYTGARFSAKRRALIALLRELRNRNVPIHGVGIQGHLEPQLSIDQNGLAELLKAIRDLGLEVMITELDVIDENLPADFGLRDELAAKAVFAFLDTVCGVVRPAAIVTWGISDKYTWMRVYRKRKDGLPNRPLPLDSAMQPKKMLAVIEEFRQLRP